MKSMVFTGGGSGGHVFPGLAVVEALRQSWNGRIVWIGSTRGIERRIVRSFGLPYFPIPAGKLRREMNLRNVADLFNVLAGIIRAYALLRKIRPVTVFSKGGYVSVPVVIAARLLRIPVYTHESDVDPGLATRINARFADGIFVAYRDTARFFRPEIRSRVIVSGNPVRSAVFSGNRAAGRESLAVPGDAMMLLVLGGSQGAHEINALVWEALPELTRRFFVVHQTGEQDAGKAPRYERYLARAFFGNEFAEVLGAADIVVARSGAGTVWELAVTGKPSLLIPLRGTGTRGDQVLNAELFERAGAALVLDGNEGCAGLVSRLFRLCDDAGMRSAMSAAAAKFARRDAAEVIAAHLLDHHRDGGTTS